MKKEVTLWAGGRSDAAGGLFKRGRTVQTRAGGRSDAGGAEREIRTRHGEGGTEREAKERESEEGGGRHASSTLRLSYSK